MGLRNKKRETLRRLEAKSLEARFLHEIRHGLNGSPFEARAVLEVVREVYFPFFDEQAVKAPPGKITLLAVSAEEPAGKAIADCEKQAVCLTVHRGSEDDRLLEEPGPKGFRRARIPELGQEALSQGGLLTREDLAYRVFFVSPRTIARVLEGDQRATGQVVPRRATVHDVGTGLTHKRIICLKRYREGKPSEQIARETYHSMEAVDRYLGQFDRVHHCRQEGMPPLQIAYMLDCSLSLVREYLAIDAEVEGGGA